MIGGIIIGIVFFILACALVRVSPATLIPDTWKPVLYVIALILLLLWLGWRQGWI